MAKNRPSQDADLEVSREHILDARFASLSVLKELIPNLIIAIPVETVAALTGLAVSTVWSKAAQDPNFPQPKQHEGLKRTVWNLTDVQQYLADLFASSQAPSAIRSKAGEK